MDEYLDSQGFFRKQIARDGSCLFRIVSENVFYTQAYYSLVRDASVNFLIQHKDLFIPFIEEPFDDYIARLKNPKEWAGHIEMAAMSLIYKKDFIVFQEVNKLPVQVTNNNFSDCIMLCYSQGNHYDAVYSKYYLSRLAICQSIIYGCLYENVFGLGGEVFDAVKMMLHDKAYSKQRKNNLNKLHRERSTLVFRNEFCSYEEKPEDGAAEIKQALTLGIPPFPYKVAKALDPEIYRNVEFDLWNEERKEQIRADQLIVPELGPGVKCWVRLDKSQSHPFCGHVQELTSPKGPVVVFIEDIGEKRSVPFDSLEPLPIPVHKAILCTPKRGKYAGIEDLGINTPYAEKFSYRKKLALRRSTKIDDIPSWLPKYQGTSIPLKIVAPTTTTQVHSSGSIVFHKWFNSNRLTVAKENARNSEIVKNSQIAGNLHKDNLPLNPVEVFKAPNTNRGNQDLKPVESSPRNGWNHFESTSRKQATGVTSTYNGLYAPPAGCQRNGIQYPGSVVNTACGTTSGQSVNSLDVASSQLISQTSSYQPVPAASLSSPSGPPNATTALPNPGSSSQQSCVFPPMAYPNVFLPLPSDALYGPVNTSLLRSQDPSGVDLPMPDLPTIRFFYNLGCDYYNLSSLMPMNPPPACQVWNGNANLVFPYSVQQPQMLPDGQEEYRNNGMTGYNSVNMVSLTPPSGPVLHGNGPPVILSAPPTVFIPSPGSYVSLQNPGSQ